MKLYIICNCPTFSVLFSRWHLPLRLPPVALHLRRFAIPRHRQMFWNPCWVVAYLAELGLWGRGDASCLKMAAATYALSTSAGGAPYTCGTCGQHLWTCSGATSSSCSRPHSQEPGSFLGSSGIWWPWYMVTFLVREQSIKGGLMKKTLGSLRTDVSERTDKRIMKW